MKISVVFKSSLRRYVSEKNYTKELYLSEGTTIREVLSELNIIKGEVGLTILNSKIVEQDTVLSDKDELEIYPIFGGG